MCGTPQKTVPGTFHKVIASRANPQRTAVWDVGTLFSDLYNALIRERLSTRDEGVQMHAHRPICPNPIIYIYKLLKYINNNKENGGTVSGTFAGRYENQRPNTITPAHLRHLRDTSPLIQRARAVREGGI